MSSLLLEENWHDCPKAISVEAKSIVIKFLLLEGETAQNISRRLKQVHGDWDKLQHSDEVGETNQ